jgi:hypothetical protein
MKVSMLIKTFNFAVFRWAQPQEERTFAITYHKIAKLSEIIQNKSL